MNVLSLLTPKDVDEIGGLPSEAVCGQFNSDDMSPENFRVNPVFVDFMHSIIGTKGIELASLKQAAQKQAKGYLYVIDFRTPDGIFGNVPPEDIIGAFQVDNAVVVKDSYKRNDKYEIFTKNGLLKLSSDMHDLLIQELKRLRNC
jgi:hypothetical protein